MAAGGPPAGSPSALSSSAIISNNEAPTHMCSGEEATHVMEVLMGVLESSAYQRTVHLPQADRGHPLLRWRAVSTILYVIYILYIYGSTLPVCPYEESRFLFYTI